MLRLLRWKLRDGIIAAGGMLVQNDPIGMQRCSDGTSNVMILGETSTFAFQDPVLKTGRAAH